MSEDRFLLESPSKDASPRHTHSLDDDVSDMSNEDGILELNSDNFQDPTATITHYKRHSLYSHDSFACAKSVFYPPSCIVSVEYAERLAYDGILSSLLLLFRRGLGFTTTTAVQHVSLWTGFYYISPILGSYLSDQKFGMYRTILLSSVVYLFAMLGLLIALLSISMGWDNTNALTVGITYTLLWAALYFIAFASGGITYNVGPFSAKQFNPTTEERKQELESFFSWYFFIIGIMAIIAYSFVAYLCQEVSFFDGMLIPTFAVLMAVLLYYTARYRYLHSPTSELMYETEEGTYTSTPTPNVLKEFTQCSWFAFQNRHRVVTHMHWLDVAKMQHGGLYNDEFVEHMKLVYRCIGFNVFLMMYWCIYTQKSTLFYAQGCQMNIFMSKSFNVPVASLCVCDSLMLLLLIPLLDRVIFPTLRTKYNWNVTTLQRMGAGLFCAVLAMIVAGIVEVARKNAGYMNIDNNPSVCSDNLKVSNMSIFCQIPQYLLIGVSDALAAISGLEFFYNETPETMLPVVYAFNYIAGAVGAWLAAFIVVLVNLDTHNKWVSSDLNHGHLESYFFFLAGLMFATFVLFLFQSKRYRCFQDLAMSYSLLANRQEQNRL